VATGNSEYIIFGENLTCRSRLFQL